MKRFRLIPFGFLPSHWSLTGLEREKERVRYYYDGEERERRLLELEYPDPVERERERLRRDFVNNRIDKYHYECELLRLDGKDNDRIAKADVDYRHGVISKYDYEKIVITEFAKNDNELMRSLLELDYEHGHITEREYRTRVIEMECEDDVEKEIALTRLAYEFGDITEHEMNKRIATARIEPWVGVIDQEYNPNLGINGFGIELDWNEYWIEFLKINGYTGNSDEEIVDQWFADVCRSITSENVRFGGPIPPRNQFVQSASRGDGSTDYM